MNTKLAATQTQAQIHGHLTGKEKNLNARRLTLTIIAGILALAVCFLAWSAQANLAHPVTRPLKIVEGHLTITVDPNTGAYEFTDWGWATLIGKYSNSGSAGPGGLDLQTGEFVAGSGVVITANGDTINWIVGSPDTILDISGTGVFQGVTGGFGVNVLSETLLSSNSDGTVTLAITYDGNGPLTY